MFWWWGEDMDKMRKASGEIKDTSKLVCFIYLLGRDYLSLGKIEEIMENMRDDGIEHRFTNGWLAQYSQNVAERLNKKRKSKK